MIDPWLGKAAFHLGFYIAFTAGVLLFFLEKQTPEYAITQITFGIGLFFIAVVALLVRLGRKR
ncbi:MAG: hypothetical protein KJZ86_15615 [Caldilineaceae bacterium]|nr:hypothetical protein [Caldilineaceae bacterium]HRJ44172.1 hypothetical protein [Caldilineaceae bacterium]